MGLIHSCNLAIVVYIKGLFISKSQTKRLPMFLKSQIKFLDSNSQHELEICEDLGSLFFICDFNMNRPKELSTNYLTRAVSSPTSDLGKEVLAAVSRVSRVVCRVPCG